MSGEQVSEDATKAEVARRLGEPGLTLLDVRTLGEHTGELGHPADPRQGHIPGALHLDLQELLRLDPAGIEARLGVPPGSEVIAYCLSGSRSALAVQVLRAAGYDARNYGGSWHEWARDETLPAET